MGWLRKLYIPRWGEVPNRASWRTGGVWLMTAGVLLGVTLLGLSLANHHVPVFLAGIAVGAIGGGLMIVILSYAWPKVPPIEPPVFNPLDDAPLGPMDFVQDLIGLPAELDRQVQEQHQEMERFGPIFQGLFQRSMALTTDSPWAKIQSTLGELAAQFERHAANLERLSTAYQLVRERFEGSRLEVIKDMQGAPLDYWLEGVHFFNQQRAGTLAEIQELTPYRDAFVHIRANFATRRDLDRSANHLLRIYNEILRDRAQTLRWCDEGQKLVAEKIAEIN